MISFVLARFSLPSLTFGSLGFSLRTMPATAKADLQRLLAQATECVQTIETVRFGLYARPVFCHQLVNDAMCHALR